MFNSLFICGTWYLEAEAHNAFYLFSIGNYLSITRSDDYSNTRVPIFELFAIPSFTDV